MMTIRHTLLLTAALCVAVPLPGRAQQRPLVTEDPETVGLNRALVEAGFELDKDQLYSAHGLEGDTTHIATFGVSVGIGPSAEVQIDGGLRQRLKVTERLPVRPLASSADLFPGDTSSTFEDFVVATKIRLVEETESHPAMGARFGTKLPTAEHATGLGLGTTDFFATFLVAKTVQSVRTVGNFGLHVLGNPRGAQQHVQAFGFGLSVARALTNAFEVVGEVNGRLKPFDAVPEGLESRGALRFAGRYTYSMLRLDFGVLVGLTPRDPSFGISAGATYAISK